MGGVVQTLFGGSSNKNGSNQTSSSTQQSSSTSESGNKAYDFLSNALGGNVSAGNNAFNNIAALLGAGGDPRASQEAFDNYKKSTGYNFMLDSGSSAITGNKAASGLLKSGSTLKALTEFGQNLGSTTFNNYLGQLGNLFSGGLQSAGMISNAGNYSNSQSQSSGSSTSSGSSWGKGSSSNGIIPVLFG